MKLPLLLGAVVFVCANWVCAQKAPVGTVIPKVEFLSSYEGRITKLLMVNTMYGIQVNEPSDCSGLPVQFNCCDIKVTSESIRIDEHDTMVELWKEILKGSSVNFDTLQDYATRRKDILELISQGSLLPDSKLEGYAVWKLKKIPFNKAAFRLDITNADLFEYHLKRVALTTTSDSLESEWDAWRSNLTDPGTDSLVALLVKITNAYVSMIEAGLAEVYTPKEGCFPRFVNVDRYCGGDAYCESGIAGLLGTYAQDKYYGLKKEKNVSQSGYNDPTLDDTLAPDWAMTRVVKCECLSEYSMNSLNIDIPGGNMLVSDEVVFIGLDELEYRFIDTTDARVVRRLNRMGIAYKGLDREQIVDSVNTWLSKNLFADKKVVWVGTDTPRLRYHKDLYLPIWGYTKGHSPLYHIDMFMALLGKMKSSGDSLVYILALPDTNFQDMDTMDMCYANAYREMIGNMREHIFLTAEKMEEEVKQTTSQCVLMKRVIVPMPVLLPFNFRCDQTRPDEAHWLEVVFSFANGFAENCNGKVTYYMPIDDGTGEDNFYHAKYEEAIDTTLKKLKKLKVKVVPVKHNYIQRSGLHCIAVVLERSN